MLLYVASIVIILVSLIILVAVVAVTLDKKTSVPVQCSDTQLDTLPELDRNSSQCLIGGISTGLVYYPAEDFVLSSVQTSVIAVCGQDQDCAVDITSDNCEGVAPMARLGSIKYYPFSQGSGLCDNNPN